MNSVQDERRRALLANLKRGGGGIARQTDFFFRGFRNAEQHAWQVQRPTRVTQMAIWGARNTTVQHLQINGVDQLVGPVPAGMFAPMLDLSLLLDHFGPIQYPLGDDCTDIFESARSVANNAERLAVDSGVRLELPSMSPGQRLVLEIKGPFQACALFAMELP